MVLGDVFGDHVVSIIIPGKFLIDLLDCKGVVIAPEQGIPGNDEALNGLFWRLDRMDDRAALHEDEFVVPVMSHRGGGKTIDVLGSYLLQDRFIGSSCRMMTFIHQYQPIGGNHRFVDQ